MEIIKVNQTAEGVTVSGRELHKALEVKTLYKDWFPRMCEYGFELGTDFNPLKNEQVQTEGSREVRREVADHLLTIPMAKEIAMLQRTPKGKEVRQYLIKVEEAWNTPELIMARALQVSQKLISELKPKADFADKILGSKTSILINELAKLLCQNGYETGEKRLFQQFRDNGYLCTNGERYNLPTQYAMGLGLFEIIERPVQIGTDTIIRRTVKVTPKGQQYFFDRLVRNEVPTN